MSRVFNFSAGPSTLPIEVLEQAQAELLDYQGSGQSVLEMSHRSKVFEDIIKDTENLMRDIMGIPDNYKVLFLQGGGSSQFTAIPMNFMNKNNKADYLDTGLWAKKAYKEAARYGNARIAASSADKNYSYIPKLNRENFDAEADYVYYCHNNTIYGTKFNYIPDTGNIPLIADISSSFLSEPIDVTKFAALFGGAQKNIGPAGLTVVIVREDMLGSAMNITPTMFNYKIQADAESLYNTPPCFSIYICKLVLEWIVKNGGVEAIYKNNIKKADVLYSFLDSSKLFKNNIAKEDRSLMNVTFVTGNADLDKKFLREAQEAGLINLKGHRSAGGMRASIYNAMPIEGVESLVHFLKKFEAENL